MTSSWFLIPQLSLNWIFRSSSMWIWDVGQALPVNARTPELQSLLFACDKIQNSGLFNLQDKHISGCVFFAAITIWLLQLVLSDTNQGWQKCCTRLVSVTVYTVLFWWRLTAVSVLCDLSGLLLCPHLCQQATRVASLMNTTDWANIMLLFLARPSNVSHLKEQHCNILQKRTQLVFTKQNK